MSELFRVRFIPGRRLLAFVAFASLAGCGSTLTPNTTNTGDNEDEDTVTDTFGITVSWGDDDHVDSGQAVTGMTMTEYEDTASTREVDFPTCFDNNRTCRRAADEVVSVIGNNPVAIQGFQLNFTNKNFSSGGTWGSVNVTAASVTTAELRFDGNTGALALRNTTTRQLVSGATCSLSSSNAVGYASSTGSEKILVGLKLYEEATKSTASNTSYYNAHLTSGRVWHSGLYPDGSNTTFPLGFKFEPTDDAVTQDFGTTAFTTTTSTGTKVSPVFTASDSLSNYKSHVIIGYCLEGNKAGSRPLVWFSRAFVRRPKLKKVE